MHADAHFSIGRSHTVCQDYALAGETSDGRSFAVVCDGCSSSPHTDFGARFLALSVAQQLAERQSLAIGPALEDAASMASTARLDRRCLDATLCCVFQDVADPSWIWVMMFGDGVVAARRRDGVLERWSLEAESGAPPYPSYLLDDARLGVYQRQTGPLPLERVHAVGGVEVEREALSPFCNGLYVRLPAAEYQMVAVISDGATSFQDGMRTPVSQDAVLGRLLAIRSHAGRFVTRRMSRFLGRECGKSQWTHHDDVAMAALWCG